MNIEAHGLNDVITDLTKAGLTAGVRAMAALEPSGQRMRDTARRLAPRTRLPHYEAKITHEVGMDPAGPWVEMGPERGGQGSLGHIFENGTSRTPPHAHIGPAFDLELPNAMRVLGFIAGDV